MPPRSVQDRARSGEGTVDEQRSFFDREIEDSALERLLDQRLDANEQKLTAQRAFKDKDDLVKARLSEFEIEDGEVIRIGRHRIKASYVDGGHRSFDVGGRSQLSFGVFDD